MSTYANEMAAIKSQLMPVGTIIEWCPVSGGPDLSTPAKVAAYYGFGRWEAFGTSQATVGTDSLHAPGTTWGNRTITLEAANMPTTLPLSYGDSRSGGRTVIDANAVLQQATRHGRQWRGVFVAGARRGTGNPRTPVVQHVPGRGLEQRVEAGCAQRHTESLTPERGCAA